MAANLAVQYVLCILGLGLHCSHLNTSSISVLKNSDDTAIPFHRDSTDTRQRSSTQQQSKSYSNGSVSFLTTIDTTNVIHKVDRRFLSTGIGTHGVTYNQTNSFPLNSTLLKTIAKGLSPAIFRVSGKTADQTVFTPDEIPCSQSDNVTEFFLTGPLWKELNEFTTSSGLDLAFALNLMQRNGKDWNSTNAKQLLDFNSKLGYDVIWQLGNEPNLFEKPYNYTISARQLARDFRTLRRILARKRGYDGSMLVGPDGNHLPVRTPKLKQKFNHTAYLERYLQRVGTAINATTIHFYNVRKDNSTDIDNFTDPNILDELIIELDRFSRVVKDTRPNGWQEKWLGETSVVSTGGLKGVSSTYVAGFPLLDKLGIAAKMDIKILIYWNFYGGSYSLIPSNNNPQPIYWVCLLHKRLMGTKVLSVSNAVNSSLQKSATRYVRVYAHCTLKSSQYAPGAITVIAMNMLNGSHASLHLSGNLANKTIDEYHLKPHRYLNSTTIYLNGQKLKMVDNTTFPALEPRPLPRGSPIRISPMTYGFYVIKDAGAAACMHT